MKKHINLLLLALAVALGAKAQENYTEFWHNADTVHFASHLVEDDNGNLVVCTETHSFYTSEFRDLILYAFTKEGGVVDSVIVDYMNPNSYYFLEKDPNPNDDCAILFGLVYYEEGKSIFRLLKLDDYLQTVEQFDICFFDGISQREIFLLDPHNSIILYWNDSEKANYFARIGLNGEIIDSNSFEPLEFENKLNVDCDPLAVYNTNPIQYVLSYQAKFAEGQYRNEYMVVDSLFNLLETNAMNQYFDGLLTQAGVRNFTVKQYEGRLFALVELLSMSPFCDYLEVAEIDCNFNVLKRFKFSNPNPEDSSDAVKSFTQAPGGGFYFSCYPNSLMITDYGNQVYVAKLDDNLNLEWERWCLDAMPGIWSVGRDMRVLSDGGVGLCGMLFNVGNGPRPLDFWCFTVEDTGTAIPEAEPYIRPYLIYPNPLKDRLSIQFSPDVKLESIELYDIAGHCVASSRTAEMDVANLPAGQYVAKIALEGGKTYTDKIVKE